MSQCLYPLNTYWYGEYTDNGKKKLYFSPQSNKLEMERGQVPCGKCIECRLNYARNWAIRCMAESKLYSSNYFVTLTYDDDHLFDLAGNVGAENLQYMPSVRADDISKFIKDLRSHYKYDFNHTGIRFFACTEYGDVSHRPHMHLILFNTPIHDLKFYKTTDNGDVLYNSDYIRSIWTCGHVVIGEVTFDSCAYVAKYVVKKSSETFSNCESLNIEPESIRMSRRPGIGTQYFLDNKDKLLTEDQIFVDSIKYPLPSAWLRSVEDSEESKLKIIKAKRKRLSYSTQSNKLVHTDLNLIEINEERIRKKHKPFVRKEV